ncbi:MAG: IS110 family transposase, partial [Mesorhizobium sp.]
MVDGLRSRHRNVPKCGCRKSHTGKPSIEKIATIGLDIPKHVFQVHGINGAG